MNKTFSDEIKDTIVRDCYLQYQVHRSKGNWIYSEPNWEDLGESGQKFWRDFIQMVLRRVSLEKRLLNSKEKAE